MESAGAIVDEPPIEPAGRPPADFFYGMPELPFNRYLGMRFGRDSDGGAVVRLDAREGSEHPDGAIYSLGEVAAAIAWLDELGPAQPMLMVTDTVSFRSLSSTSGEVHTRATPVAPDPAEAPSGRNKRKMRLNAEVIVMDDADRPLAELSVIFNARVVSPALREGLVNS